MGFFHFASNFHVLTVQQFIVARKQTLHTIEQWKDKGNQAKDEQATLPGIQLDKTWQENYKYFLCFGKLTKA